MDEMYSIHCQVMVYRMILVRNYITYDMNSINKITESILEQLMDLCLFVINATAYILFLTLIIVFI